MSCMDN